MSINLDNTYDPVNSSNNSYEIGGCGGDERGCNVYPSLSCWTSIENIIQKKLTPFGFEAHPFHICWYNELVGERFHLDYPSNTLALVIISGPETFEKCIIPFIKSKTKESIENPTFDPLDGSIKHVFQILVQELAENSIEVVVIHDFELHPSRRPKVLVQTAAHVAGAVEYFHRDHLNNSNKSDWLKNVKLAGVAIHPEYGGWFAIRGVIILKNVVPDDENLLPKPPKPFQTIEESLIRQLLEEFGTNWKTHVWRDLLPRSSTAKYSEDFINYLGTETSKRWDYIKSLPYFGFFADPSV